MKSPEISDKGESYRFLVRNYTRGNTSHMLSIGDQVIIHPIPDRSLATKSYPAKIVEKEITWVTSKNEPKTKTELVLVGTGANANWNGGHGAVINEYMFSRLEYKRPLRAFVNKLIGR